MSHVVAAAFGAGGGYAQIFPEYEARPEQGQMAEAVEQALSGSRHLLVEAGTGVGKSLAYLTPAALWTLEGKRRLLISTYTKLLQNQLVGKDIPLVRQALSPDLRAEPVFGQENYLCRRRVAMTINHGLFDSPFESAEIDAVLDWADNGSGVLPEFPGKLDSRTLQKIGRNSDNCLFLKCPYRDRCPYFAARERWQRAQLLVANHWLYFTNSTLDERLLPPFDAVIFDEAHRLEGVCAEQFGIDVSNAGLDRLLNRVHAPQRKRGILAHYEFRAQRSQAVDQVLAECRAQAETFFKSVRALMPDGAPRLRLRTDKRVPGFKDSRAQGRSLDPLAPRPLEPSSLGKPLVLLALALKDLAKDCDDEDIAGELRGLQSSAERYVTTLADVAAMDDKNAVYWVEVADRPSSVARRPSSPNVVLRSALIDVSPVLREVVFERHPAVVLTSATLTVNRSFQFMAERMAAREADTLLMDSPFDYSRQALLYIDDALPAPGTPAFLASAVKRITEILNLSQGRALILFTSYDMLGRVYAELGDVRFSLYRQGEASTFELLRRFREDVSSVLLATQSFWEGIDVPGEALSCLIITRLPFEVPDDPRLEGIAETMRDQGRDPFTEYQLPQAVLRFRQGFGRLIRNKTDHGVVCLLDSRLAHRAYGRLFLASLPKGIRVVRDLGAVRDFYSRKPPAASR